MRDHRLHSLLGAASLAGGLLLLGACNDLLGIETPTHREGSGGGEPGGGGHGGTGGSGTISTSNTGGSNTAGNGGNTGGSSAHTGGSGGAPGLVCGNGTKEGTEECDEGAQNSDTGACLTSCNLAKCGDGKMWTGEELCDDGNDVEGDGCFQCKPDCGCPGCTAGAACNGCGLNGSSAGVVSYKPAGSNHCYSIDPVAKSWADALSDCQGKGGSLAALSTIEELNDVMKPEIAAVIEASVSKRGWIGCNDMVVEGTYTWTNGETFTYALGSPPWEGAEPGASDDCTVLGRSGNGTYTLRGNSCASTRSFLCEKTLP